MNAAPLFDTFTTLFVIGLMLNIGTLVTFLIINAVTERRSVLPRAIARSR
jgi:hypothetical protein